MAAVKYILIVIFSGLAMKTDAELTIKADPPSPSYEQNVTITCSILSFSDIASFIRGDSNVILTNCFSRTSNCVPKKVGRYTFGATSATIFVVISGVDILNDSFPWKCQYRSKTVNITLTFNKIATTNVAPSSDNTGRIVGVAAGVIPVCVAFILLIICIMKKRNRGRCLIGRKKGDSQKEQDANSAPGPSKVSIRSTEELLVEKDCPPCPTTLSTRSTEPLLPQGSEEDIIDLTPFFSTR